MRENKKTPSALARFTGDLQNNLLIDYQKRRDFAMKKLELHDICDTAEHLKCHGGRKDFYERKKFPTPISLSENHEPRGDFMENFVFRGNEYYKRKIIEMASEMQNPEILKLLYGFMLSGYKEEKAGRT